MGDSYEVQEVQEVQENASFGGAENPPLEPVYFMMGFIAGLLFISLFKGRWFL